MGYEVKARSTSEMMDGTFQLYRNHFSVFAGLAIPIYGVVFAATMLTNRVLTGHFVIVPKVTPVPVAHHVAPATPQLTKPQMIAFGLTALFGIFGALISNYLLVVAVSMAFNGDNLTTSTVLDRAGTRFGRYLGAAFKASVLNGLGYLFFIIPGVIMSLNWMLFAQVVVFESNDVNALDRSKTLVYGSRGRIATILFLVTVIAGVIGGAAGGLAAGSPLVSQALQRILQALIAPVAPCLMTLAYIDCRVRKEGYDMEIRARQTGPQVAVASLAPGHGSSL